MPVSPSIQAPAWPARRTCAWLAVLFLTGTLAATWALETVAHAPPCHLCSLARLPYYLALLPAAAALFCSGARGWAPFTRACFALIAMGLAVSAGISLYHAGVQWRLWAGPDRCSGTSDMLSATTADLLQQLQATQLTRCDEPGFSLFGISLAAWNVLFSSAAARLAWQARKPAASLRPIP